MDLMTDCLCGQFAQQAGAKYDLRTYDDAIVKGGNTPMTLLESVIDQFIAKNRG